MIITHAKARLNKLLIREGMDITCPNPFQALKAFRAFAKETVECAEDLFMFQCGVFSFSGERLFHLVFVRQFIIKEEGRCDNKVQLYIEFTCKPNESLTALSTIIWAEEFTSMELYFERIENSTEFSTAMVESTWDCKVHQEAVSLAKL
ncbi:MAG: hypothetical protein ABSA26_09170 [Thermoguttaceae bacterium]|jgi:hypothetical protein